MVNISFTTDSVGGWVAEWVMWHSALGLELRNANCTDFHAFNVATLGSL